MEEYQNIIKILMNNAFEEQSVFKTKENYMLETVKLNNRHDTPSQP